MNLKKLKEGFLFAAFHNLPKREIEILIPFLEGPKNAKELAKELPIGKKVIYSTLQRLRLKGILQLKETDEMGNFTYEFLKSSVKQCVGDANLPIKNPTNEITEVA